MKIKKIGHCCLLIKTNGITILTDPGCFSVDQDLITGIDIVLITHEHADHLHVDSLKNVLANNPLAKVITNSGVAKILQENGIKHTLLEGKSEMDILGIKLAACDGRHEEIFEEIGQVQNTGYFIANQLFYPGDSFTNPGKPIEILALPVAGPWCKIVDAIRYALRVKPKKAFPVHDGMLQKDRIGSSHSAPKQILNKNGIEFVVMNPGDESDL